MKCRAADYTEVHRVSSVTNPSVFPLPNNVRSVFPCSPENFLVSYFIKPDYLFILLHIHISEISNLLLSVCHVSAAYSATLQTKHFVTVFFSL